MYTHTHSTTEYTKHIQTYKHSNIHILSLTHTQTDTQPHKDTYRHTRKHNRYTQTHTHTLLRKHTHTLFRKHTQPHAISHQTVEYIKHKHTRMYLWELSSILGKLASKC